MNQEVSKNDYAALDAWIDAHFDEQVAFLQELVKVSTDTPPGNNAPHAVRTAELLSAFDMKATHHPVPADEVKAAGMESITNLIVRREYDATKGPTIALNAHGDVVPPGDGWTNDPYAAEIFDGKLYGRATAVSKSDFSTFTFAVRALEDRFKAGTAERPSRLKGAVELHFTYDEEFGGELGPAWLLKNNLSKPDLMIAAGFSYEVVTAHNGCLQIEVTVEGDMAHAAIPDSGVDALQGSVHIMQALYALNAQYLDITSKVPGITHPYLNIGLITGGTNTNVVPGKVVFKLDRRMIPEEDPVAVEASILSTIEKAVASYQPPRGGKTLNVHTRRLLLARAMVPLAGNAQLVESLQTHGQMVFGEPIPAIGTPLYTDVRLYVERGIPGVIYGAGPRTVRESNAKRADEHLDLEDLRRATKVVARTLADLLVGSH